MGITSLTIGGADGPATVFFAGTLGRIDDILLVVVLGFILDLLIGDPHWLYHPVQAIGKLISVLEKVLRKIFPKTKTGERIGGCFLVGFVVGISVGVTIVLLRFCYHVHWGLGIAVETVICYQMLATKSLKTESMKVYDALKTGDIEKSRKAVSMIVGRDTQNLTEEGVTKAAVETVAENASDGVLAPLFYMVIGGGILAVAYKSINTMDSMVGYKNDRYQYFGTAAALLDDLANYIPARLSALLMILAAGVEGMDAGQAARIYKRDRYKHASPNSAHTESVMAGALRIQLAGDAWYFGELHKKDYIGDPLRPVEIGDIKRANRLLYATAIIALLVFCLLRVIVLLVFARFGGM